MTQPILERLAEHQAAVQKAAAAVSANIGDQAKARAALEQAERAIRAYHRDVGDGKAEDDDLLDVLIRDRNARADRMSRPDPKSKEPPVDLRLAAQGDKLRRLQREAEVELREFIQRHRDALDGALRERNETARQMAYEALAAVTETKREWGRVAQLYAALSPQLYGGRAAPPPVIEDVRAVFEATLQHRGDSPIPEPIMRQPVVRVTVPA